ncbi:MAG: TetR/AcrR family transcriptional regulator [Rhodospirillales bacterium]
MQRALRRKSADVRREEIIEASLALLADNGPRGLTTGAIAGAIGVSQPAVFRHFPTKGAILVACVDAIGDRIRPAIEAALSGQASAEARLREVVAAILRVARTIPAMPTTMFSRELHAEFPVVREMIRERRRRFADALAQILTDGVHRGEFAPDLDAGTGAWLIIGLIHAVLLRWHHGEAAGDPIKEAAMMIQTLLYGFKRR